VTGRLHAGRIATRSLISLALAGAGVLGIASAARAQTPPPSPAPTVTVPTGNCDGLTGHGLDICKANPHMTMPGGVCYDNIHDPSGLDICLKLHEFSQPKPILDLGGEMIPGDVGARFPPSAYGLGYDDSNPTDATRRFQGTIMTSGWSIHMLMIRFGLFAVAWAFSFGFAARLAGPAADAAHAFTTHLVGPLGLGYYALLATGVAVAILLFRGKGTKAAGELAVTYAIFMVMGVLLANPAGYLRGAYSTVSDVSGQILSASTDPTQGLANPQPAANSFDHPEFAVRLGPLNKSIAEALIDKPFDQLQWGEILTGKCAAIRDAIILSGPWGNDNYPRSIMATQPECKKYADMNADPANGDRWMWSWFFVLLSFLVMILLVGIAITVVGAQLWGVFLIVAMPIAAALGLAPRHTAIWKWTASAAKAAGAILACSALLVFFVMLFSQGLIQTQNDPAAVKLVFLGTVTVGAFVAKKHFLAAGAAASASLGAKLGSLGSGGGYTAAAGKGHRVGKTVLGISAAGAAQRFAHKLPGRVGAATMTAVKKGLPPVAAAAVVAGKAGKRGVQALGAYGNIFAIAGTVPIQNRIEDARQRLADVRGRLVSPLQHHAVGMPETSRRFADSEDRARKIREGLAEIAAQRARQAQGAAAFESAAVHQDEARAAFNARVQGRVRDLAANKALADLEALRSARRQRAKP